MSTESLIINNPGIFTTIQDLGRRGFLDSGIPPSGAMDKLSFKLGNLLVGNPEDAAALEMTTHGISFEATQDMIIAITGAQFEASLNGQPMPLWHTVLVKSGDKVRIGKALQGWRGYLCIAGGIDVPMVLGSRSTYTMGGLGGCKGRALKKGDSLPVQQPAERLDKLQGYRVDPAVIPDLAEARELRVVLGPQDDHVQSESLEAFASQQFLVLHNSNRVGYRFQGPQLFFKEKGLSKDAGSDPSNIVDDGNAIGAIQIPAGKEPICLGPDGVTMGGYVKIACLISSDMSRMAQLRLQEKINFKVVSIEQAHKILRAGLSKVDQSRIIPA